MTIAYIGLGSNIGNREQELEEAVRLLNDTDGIKVVSRSSIYTTAPVGYTEQPDFLNMCIGIDTTLAPASLLQRCLDIEQIRHRVREQRWGPRTLDVDILLYGDEIVTTAQLEIPHPRMTSRAFVMIPLCEIAADRIEPHSGKKIGDFAVEDDTVKKYKD